MSFVMRKPRFLAEKEKQISQPQTEMVVGLETEKEPGRCTHEGASVSLFSFSLFSNTQVRISERQVSREDIEA